MEEKRKSMTKDEMIMELMELLKANADQSRRQMCLRVQLMWICLKASLTR